MEFLRLGITLPIATAIGAWGGFPEPPTVFKKLAEYQLFQYFLMFVLIWQGGGQQNSTTAFVITMVMVFLKLLDNLYSALFSG